jgi:hypothetical protein
VNIWEQVLDEQTTAALGELDEGADASALNYDGMFATVVQHYLEEVQGLKFIGDAAIRFLTSASNKKPAAMTPAKFFRRRATILGFVTGGYLRFKLSVPTTVQLNEAAFLSCVRVWQEKYAETNEEVTADTGKLISAFSAYHTADIRAGTLKKIQKDKEEKKRKASKTNHQDNRCGGKRSGSGHTRERDDRREYRDDRGYQRDRFHDRRDQRDGQKGRDNGKREGQKKPPYKRSAREEAHHANEERARSRSRSSSRSRSPSSVGSRGSRGEEGFHQHQGTTHGQASGHMEYSDSDMEDDRPQDKHKSYVQGGYRTFNAPSSRGKR